MKIADKLHGYLYPLVLICIILTHINISYFIPNFLHAQFFACALIIILFFIQFYFTLTTSETLRFNLIDMLVLSFYGYLLLNNIFFAQNIFREEFINFSSVFCIYYFVRCHRLEANTNFIYLQITALLIIIIEAIYCFLQWKNVIPNLNSNYKIGGSYGHPAFTAVSISVVIPYLIYPLGKYPFNKIFVKSIFFIFMLTLLLLFKLESRAAVLSAILSFTAIFVLPNIKELKKLKAAVAAFLVASIIFAVVFIKSDSSLGRIFVWKKCLTVINENLFFGVGFGRFAFEYNKYQSLFFSGLSQNTKEALLADYSESAFNEFFQVGVEMGLLGVALFVALIACLFCYKNNKLDTKPFFNAVLCAFVPLFVGWSVLRYFPISCFFFISLAILAKQNRENFIFKLTNKIALHVFSAIIPISLVLFVYNRSNHFSINVSIINDKELKYADNLNRAFKELQHSDNYVYKYCEFLIKDGQYGKAQLVAEKSCLWLNSPTLYHILYQIHYQQNDFAKANQDLVYLINISPSKIYPKYALAKLFYTSGEKRKGDSLAELILKIRPKIVNADVLLMKEELKTHLNKK